MEKEINISVNLGMKTWPLNPKLRIRKYVRIFDFFGFSQWIDLLDPNYDEWTFCGITIYKSF